MGLTRREALRLGLAAGSTLASPLGWPQAAIALEDCNPSNLSTAPFSPRLKRFSRPLPIPDVLSPSHSTADTDCYEIEIQQTVITHGMELEDGSPIQLSLPLWGLKGTNQSGDFRVPGPLIRQPAGKPSEGGRQSQLRFINRLPVVDPNIDPIQACGIHGSGISNFNSIVIHLHGMNALPEYDGYALDCIPPNYYKDYLYPNDSAGVLWYHDHTIDRTASNVYEGVAGMYLAESNAEKGIGLPEAPYDIPLMIQDRSFDSTGQLRCFDSSNHNNFYGDVITVNGLPFPFLEVERRPYRFRLLNASLSRTYQLALSQPNLEKTVGGTIVVIGTDEGLMPRPVAVMTDCQTIALGVAERYDTVIDFSQYEAGDRVYLRNVGYTGTIDSDDRTHTILCFKVAQSDRVAMNLPSTLPSDFYEIPVRQAVRQRTFRFSPSGRLWAINGKTWDRDRLDANPKLNDVEIWEFVNPGSGWVHPVHPHLVRFRILDRNGIAPPCYQRGWKDVALVGEFQKVRVLMQFTPHPGRYMMHCHNLIHEDHAMMTQFEVGTGAASPLSKPALPIVDPLPALNPPAYKEVPLPASGEMPPPCPTRNSCLRR
jgi:spore coat protein A, manganese oxidase